ncbi:MAG TPA: flavoprotein [Pirellulales bacterium]|jgi:phosphopantothenoylcysteine decarboxylase/phosphopantothenate--cysteine ligase|nr:flavoprotein [Pirellulales bacterium]
MNGRELVVGITGGIASYKTAALVSQLAQAGAGVSVVMTKSAGEFIGPATFEALSGRPVYQRLFAEPEFPLGAHIGLAERASVLCVAPATANFLAKAALGLADDLLTTLLLAFAGPVLLAPAMNSQMWSKPSVERNVAQLRADGIQIIDPEEGWLSCRQHGAGRMASPETIFAAIRTVMEGSEK